MKTTLHYYRFDISNESEAKEYKNLCVELKSKGLKVFDSIAEEHSTFYKELIKPLDNTVIELETEHLFNNQWNTAPTITSEKGIRVFDWSEPIYPNKKIKEGMYLDQTSEMARIRMNTYKCNYCGAQYVKPAFKFCTSCIGSRHLTPDNLHLLALTPVFADKYLKASEVIIPDTLLKEYEDKQKENRMLRAKKAQEAKLADLLKKIEDSKLEYRAFKLLISNNIDFDNVIYYSHTKQFCFGWRNSLDTEEKEALSLKLKECGFSKTYKVTFK